MLLVRPKRGLEKPLGGARLQRGHPLATGLIFCLALNEGGPNWNNRAALPVVLDACGNFVPSFVSASSNLVWNTPGPGYNFDTVSKRIVVPELAGTLACSIPVDAATVLFIRRKTDATQRTGVHFGPNSATVSNRCGAHLPYSDGNMYWDFGGASGDNRLTVSGLSWGTGVEHMAFTAGRRGLAFWRNGQKLGSTGVAVTRTRTASEEFRINSGHASDGDLQDIFFLAVANVQWDDSLVAWWMQEPYGMFAPQSPLRTYFIVGPDAGSHIDAKCLPFNTRGAVAFEDVDPVGLDIIGRAARPYPPGNVKINGQYWPDGAAFPGEDAVLTWSHRNREELRDLGMLVRQDDGNRGDVEGDCRVEVLLDGAVVEARTQSGITGTSFTYLYTEYQTDDPTETLPVRFRITPVNGALEGAARTTDEFFLGVGS